MLRGALQGARLDQRRREVPEMEQPHSQPESHRQKQTGRQWIAAGPPSQAFEPAGRPGVDRLAGQEPLQITGQLLRRSVTASGRLAHALQTDDLEVPGNTVMQLPRRPGLFTEDL